MANNIGTHAAELIEKVIATTWALDGAGRLGGHLQCTYDPRDYSNLIEVLAAINAERLSDLTEYLERQVLPIVAHINQGIKK